MNPPFADPWRASRRVRKARDIVLFAGAFVAGAAIGFGVVAHAVGRDVFDRFDSVTRR